MIYRNITRLVIALLVLLIIFSAASAFAAGIQNMPNTHLIETTDIITVSDLVPAECDSLRSAITTLVVCNGGHCSGSNANELILGTAADDTIDGKNGSDCIVGGDGNDDLNGGDENDVLIGGHGDDDLNGGQKKDTDVCYGGSGANVFEECDLTD